jgi:hypothetical protein
MKAGNAATVWKLFGIQILPQILIILIKFAVVPFKSTDRQSPHRVISIVSSVLRRLPWRDATEGEGQVALVAERRCGSSSK